MIAIIQQELEGVCVAMKMPEYTITHEAFYICGCRKKSKYSNKIPLVCPKHPDGLLNVIHSVSKYTWPQGEKGPQEPNGPPEGKNGTKNP